jgi:hypothetical protein
LKVRSGNLSFSVRRNVIGCGMSEGECLALSVRGRDGAWSIKWGLQGNPYDQEFVRRLNSRVWRRPFWAPPVGSSVDNEMALCTVDLSFHGDGKGRVRNHEIKAALRTQVSGRLVQSAVPLCLHGFGIKDRDKGGRHLIGAAATQELIDDSYRFWKREVRIINPHIGSNAIALANLYLALYPREQRQARPWRMVVLEGHGTTHALLMHDWRLMDAIAYQMMEGQALDSVLLNSWVDFLSQDHQPDGAIETIVIETSQSRLTNANYEPWNPFTDTPLKMDAQAGALMEQHPQQAALAFGMALQGG